MIRKSKKTGKNRQQSLPKKRKRRKQRNPPSKKRRARSRRKTLSPKRKTRKRTTTSRKKRMRSSNTHSQQRAPVAASVAAFPPIVTRPTLDANTRFELAKAITIITASNTVATGLDSPLPGQATGFTRNRFL